MKIKKIRLTFKDPDAIYESIDELFDDPDDNFELFEKWVEYGEYVTIEIDAEEGTARVVPVSELR